MDIKTLGFFGFIGVIVFALVGGGLAASNATTSPYAPNVQEAGAALAEVGEEFVESFPADPAATPAIESVLPADPNLQVGSESISGNTSGAWQEGIDSQPQTGWQEGINTSPQNLRDAVMTLQQAGSWFGNSASQTQIDVQILSDTQINITVYFVHCMEPCNLADPGDPNRKVAGFGTTGEFLNTLTDLHPYVDSLQSSITTWARDYGVQQDAIENLENDMEFFKAYLKGVEDQHNGLDQP